MVIVFCFHYIFKSFQSLSNEKLKAAIFYGPQIRQLTTDQKFCNSMNEVELVAWLSIVEIVKIFLGNYRAGNYKEIVNNMLGNIRILGTNVSIKVHFLYCHLNQFSGYLDDVSHGQVQRFNQDINTIEERYQGRYGIKMMAGYCWNLKRDKPDSK